MNIDKIKVGTVVRFATSDGEKDATVIFVSKPLRRVIVSYDVTLETIPEMINQKTKEDDKITTTEQIYDLVNNGCTRIYCSVCPAHDNTELCDALRHIATTKMLEEECREYKK